MVCQSEVISSFRSHSPVAHEDGNRMEMGLPSVESTTFIPVEEDISYRDDDESDRQLGGSGGNTDTGSSNLGILVISERLPSDAVLRDADGFDHSVSQINYKGITIGDEDIEDDQSLQNKSEPDEVKKGGWCINYLGILLGLTSGLIYAIGGVIVKFLKGYHPFTLAIFRFQGILIPGLFMVLYSYYVRKVAILEPLWPLTQKIKAKRGLGLLLRGIFGTMALVFHFYALQTSISLADALVINSCQPVLVTVVAYFCLGESCGYFSIFTALLTMLGVGVISRPPILTGEESFDMDALIGAGFAMCSMFGATMVFVIIRYLRDLDVSLITFAFGLWGTICATLGSVIVEEFTLPQTWEDWLLAVALAAATFLGQITLTVALHVESSGTISLIRTCDTLFAFFLQFVLLNTIPDLFSVTGAIIIIFCVALTTFRKWMTTLPDKHKTRKRFWFVLC